MSDTRDDTATDAQAGLFLASVNTQGQALGLRPGDLLIGIDGAPIDGQVSTLRARAPDRPGRAQAFWFLRDGQRWPLLTDSSALGRWRTTRLPEVPPVEALPDTARNWDVVCDDLGRYDAQPRNAPLLALLAPVYLLQMRLWSPLAVWLALTAICLPLGWIAGGALQVLICLYFWRAAPMLFRTDRAAGGFRLWRVIAAPSEAALHRRMSILAPNLRFVHARRADPAAEAAVAQE